LVIFYTTFFCIILYDEAQSNTNIASAAGVTYLRQSDTNSRLAVKLKRSRFVDPISIRGA